MTWANPNTPNLVDYTAFLRGHVGIPETVMPSDSPFISYALNRARNLVINVSTIVGSDYTWAVYNCASHIQLTITPDIVVNGVSRGWFDARRQECGLLKTVNGTVSSSSDQGSSTSNSVSEAMKELTIEDLGFMKTLFGRDYLTFNQSFGGPWGLT